MLRLHINLELIMNITPSQLVGLSQVFGKANIRYIYIHNDYFR